MRHFPIFLNTRGERIIVSGASEVAIAKLRLLLKTEAQLEVFGCNPLNQVVDWARDGRLELHQRDIRPQDMIGAKLVYAANDDEVVDGRIALMGRRAGILVNVVDNLDASEFITPAIVDRDPVTVAIGTEGAAPVLARKIKADVEAMLPSTLGVLARVGQSFRGRASMLKTGRSRREFWTAFYFQHGPIALRTGGKSEVVRMLYKLLGKEISKSEREGHVAIVGAGPGDPDLLTRKALKLLHEADVVIHDRLVSIEVLELVRREATVIEAGKTGFGESWDQNDINSEMIRHAEAGAQVVRLKGGDPVVFGRLDEEIAALRASNISFEIVPGITAASAAASSNDVSLTSRGRNTSLQILTAHDVQGFTEADWRSLAKPGATAAIYMGKRAARFVSGRLSMHGAPLSTPVLVVANATRTNQQNIQTNIAGLPDAVDSIEGPAVILYGIQNEQEKHEQLVEIAEGVI